MADLKITELPEQPFSSITNNDVMVIVDVETDDTNKITLGDLKDYVLLDDTYTTGVTLDNNVLIFDRTDGVSAYTVNISSAGPFPSLADYGFVPTLPPSSALTINTNITLNYPSGTTVNYEGPLIIGDNGSVVIPDGVTLIITSGTT